MTISATECNDISVVKGTSIEVAGNSTQQEDEIFVCNSRQVNQLEKEVSEARGEVIQLKRQLEEATDEIEKLTPSEVIDARQEVTKLRKQLEEAKDEIRSRIEAKVRGSEFRIQKLAEKLKFLFFQC